MSTELLYLDDAYLRAARCAVTIVDDARVALDRTIFYPTGGGQPHDTGSAAVGRRRDAPSSRCASRARTCGTPRGAGPRRRHRRSTADDRLGAAAPAHAHPHRAARAVRGHLERVGRPGHRRQHGAPGRPHGLRARPHARGLRRPRRGARGGRDRGRPADRGVVDPAVRGGARRRRSSARRSAWCPSRCRTSGWSTSSASTSRPTAARTCARPARSAACGWSRPSRRARATSVSASRSSIVTATASRSTTCATGLRRLGRVVVAFSGGADSAFLAWVAHDTLGPERALAVTAVSPSLAAERAGRLPRRWPPSGGCAGSRSRPTRWLQAAYARNDGDRCYWCKDALLRRARAGAPARPTARATVVLGVNVDDLGDHRPGQRAAAERGAALPAGRRRLHQGRRAGRGRSGSACAPGTSRPPPAWRPACPTARRSPSAASRRVERAEAGLHALGFADVRVRHYGDTARLEVPARRLADVVART